MSAEKGNVHWNKAKERWHWQFKATVGGLRHRASKLLSAGLSQAQAQRIGEGLTAKEWAQISNGPKAAANARVPLISKAVYVYTTERCPELGEGDRIKDELASIMPFYQGRRLDELGAVSREYTKANAEKPEDERLAPATVQRRLAWLRSAAKYAHKHHQLGSLDYVAQMSFPSVRNERQFYLTHAEVLRWARAVKPVDDIARQARALILLTFASGSRPGEMCTKAEKQLTENGPRLFMGKTKNGLPRMLSIPEKLLRYLKYWNEAGATRPMEYAYTTYCKRLREGRALLKLDHIHPHDLRHSAAASTLANGGTPFDVKTLLGHESMQSTDRYMHLSTGYMDDLVNRNWKKKGKKEKRV